MKRFFLIFSIFCFSTLISCNSSSTSSVDSNSNLPAKVSLQLKAIFSKTLAKTSATYSVCGTSIDDQPGIDAGLDCDQDSGIVSYTTPQQFRGAFRNVYLYNSNGDTLQLINNTETLSESEVIDMTQTAILEATESAAVHYTNIHAEVYYLDMQLEINHPDELHWVRIYMSDDDFASEGSLGHHQGDIVLLDSNSSVLGWAQGCAPWSESDLETTRSASLMGAGGIDPETGHARGFFGDQNLWNSAAFEQGDSQDIYTINSPFSLDLQGGDSATVQISFDVENLWYFEDYDSNGVFSPGGNNQEMCDETSTWAPLIPMPQFDVVQ